MQLESPKELLLRMCVFPLKLWFVPHNCRQEGWHVLYRNLLHCQNPHSEFSKWTVLLEKYCVTKFIHTWKRQCNASKSKYFSWPDLSFRVLVSFSRQTDFQDLNIPSWLKTDKILAVLPFFSETWRLFHVFMLCQASLRQKLPSCVRADFSPPMPHTLRQPTENMVVATQGNAQLWQPESHPSPSHLPGSQSTGSNTRVTEDSCCWESTAPAPLTNSFLFSQNCLCFSSSLHAGRRALCSQGLQFSAGCLQPHQAGSLAQTAVLPFMHLNSRVIFKYAHYTWKTFCLPLVQQFLITPALFCIFPRYQKI